MIVLSGATLVLPDRQQGPASLIIDGDRIVDIVTRQVPPAPGVVHVDLAGHVVVPGFVDIHVHGVGGHDALDGAGAVAAMAAMLPRYGVTGFCPTSIACPPAMLRQLLAEVRAAQGVPAPGQARVLSAHLESNFLSPEYRGAQPLGCLRLPPRLVARPEEVPAAAGLEFTGADILSVIDAAGPGVGTVTLAPELDGAEALIGHLAARGIRVSLGHSAATFEQGLAAIEAGACSGTHLFNRMPPLGHREPGLAGAVLTTDAAAAEIVCDGVHVHPAMIRLAIRAKGPDRVMAITDATSGAARLVGERLRLGGRAITVRDTAAFLDDGTLAGSTLTMDRAFRLLVTRAGCSLIEAARLCATSPARELRLADLGAIAVGAVADLAVLSPGLAVVQTYVGGQLAWPPAAELAGTDLNRPTDPSV